ncbi:hypothetical protein NZ30_04290 [Xanthomonas translucens pv. undulosa]|nr:hypothetical protein FD63_04305 [Xanthomonas translucens pv. undulosa]AVY65608.1 hypothetical protein NZ30_04290 [Xanthomonas translucens pv. undulosa]
MRTSPVLPGLFVSGGCVLGGAAVASAGVRRERSAVRSRELLRTRGMRCQLPDRRRDASEARAMRGQCKGAGGQTLPRLIVTL